MKSFGLELKLLFADRATWGLLVVFVATLVYGLVNGAEAGARARDNAEAVQRDAFEWNRQVREVLERQSLDPRQVAGRPTSALLPPAPVPALAVGQSDLLPSVEQVSLWRLEKPSEGRAELENPSRLMAGRFDLAFVLVWLFPLFLLAAAYDLCAGDRESGTLRMALAQGASPRRWIALRALARGTPILALAVAATLFAGSSGTAPDAGQRGALAALVVLAYGLFWLAVAAVINGFARSAAAAAMAAGTIWVVFVLVVPTLLNVVVESLHPAPSRAELVAEARAAASDAEKRGNELISSFYRDHPELAPPGMQADMMSRMLAVQDEVGRAMEPVKERFDEAILAQQQVVDRWRFASPAIATHEALTELAGTGYWRHRAFREQVEAFKGAVHAYYSPKFHKRVPLTKADLPHFPRFEFAEEPASVWRARVLAGVAGILALALACGIWAATRLSPQKLSA
ncbi:MAG: DUF3526 domain-containing protein [Planctomycetes bacterium]|nr:DUF3526 domain-containing protein [Planctomycetota bacterium]